MTVEKIVTAYVALDTKRRIRFLVDFAHRLTVVARETYVAGTMDVADPQRLRMFSELQHRIIGYIREMLAECTNRYPDVILIYAIAEDDINLVRDVAAALDRCS